MHGCSTLLAEGSGADAGAGSAGELRVGQCVGYLHVLAALSSKNAFGGIIMRSELIRGLPAQLWITTK